MRWRGEPESGRVFPAHFDFGSGVLRNLGMKRIVIVGSAGTGKSTLARRLGTLLGAPVIHLDELNWEPGWKALPVEVFRSRLKEAISGEKWITDGNYAIHSFDLRMPRADLVIWVDRPVWHCLWRVFRRAIGSHFRVDEDLAKGCKERLDRRFLDRLRYIANFNRVNRPRIEAQRLAHGPNVPVVVLRGDSQISAFLAGCDRTSRPKGESDLLEAMSEEQKPKNTQPDKNEAANERPVPSQAEGDLETVEEDLKQKESKNKS